MWSSIHKNVVDARLFTVELVSSNGKPKATVSAPRNVNVRKVLVLSRHIDL